MELRYDLRKLGIHHEQEDLDAHEAAKLMIKEIERLREEAQKLKEYYRKRDEHLRDTINDRAKENLANLHEIERLREKANFLLTTIYDAGDLLDDGELTATSNTLDAAKFKHNLEK